MKERIHFIKKTLSLLICLSVLFTSTSMSVLAEETIDTEFESEVLSETSEAHQQLSLLEEELKLDETLEFASDGSYSWITPMPNFSCFQYGEGSIVHVFESKESTKCKCTRNPITPDQVVAEISFYNGSSTLIYYSNKFENLVKYGNSKTSASDITYKLVNDYNYTGDEDIIFSGSNVLINLDKYCLDLGSAQILTENGVTVTVQKLTNEDLTDNVAITSSNDHATIAGNVVIRNSISSNRLRDRMVIKNTGNGCAIAGSSITLNGKIDISSANNHALNVNSDLLLRYLYSFDDILLSSGASCADINLNSEAKIKLLFAENVIFSSDKPLTPYTINVSSALDAPFTLIEAINTITSDPEIQKTIKNHVFQPMNTEDNRLLAYDKNGDLVLMICDHPSLNLDGTCSNCSNPMEASMTANGTTSNYLSLEDAIKNAPDGAVIQLVQDDLSANFGLANNLTLDLNGKTLRSSSDGAAIFSINAADVIITDSSQEKSGKMIGSVYLSDNATLTVNEGHFVRNNDQSNFTLGYIPEEPPIQLNGGTFENGFYVTEANTQKKVPDSYNFFDFIAPNYVYRDKDGNAIYPENEDSGSGLKNSRIYSFSPLDLSKDVTATLDQETFTYNGEDQVPTIQLSYCGQPLDTADFTITFPADRVSAELKTLTIQPNNDGIIGETSAKYVIKKAPLTLVSASTSDRIYNGSNQVAVSEVYLSGVITGDDVSVQGNDLTGTLDSANAGEYSLLTIDNLTLAGADSANYEVVLPARVNTAVKILPTDIINVSVTLDGTLTYNGKEQEQKILVGQLDGRDITYTVTGNKAVNIGTYELTVTGTGNYTGSVKVPYTISCNHAKQKVTVIKAPTVFDKGKELLTCTNCGTVSERDSDILEPTIKLSTATLPLKVKQSVRLKSLVSELAAGDSIKSWSINKKGKSYATLKGDKITGKKVGTATITVTLKSGMQASFKVKVQKKSVTTSSIKVDTPKITLQVGKSTKLKPIISPITSKQKVTYKSSNKEVAAVNSTTGKVVAKKPGKAVITIKSGSKSVKVTVTVPVPELKGIKLSATKKTLKRGRYFTLKAILQPTGAVGKVTYKTSDSKIATVSKNGKVTAKRKGKVNIIVKAGEFEAKCRVTVK